MNSDANFSVVDISDLLTARHIATVTPLRVGDVRIPTRVGTTGDVLTSHGIDSLCTFRPLSLATTSTAGLLSSRDKSRLDALHEAWSRDQDLVIDTHDPDVVIEISPDFL